MVWSVLGTCTTLCDGRLSLGGKSFGLRPSGQHGNFRVHRSVRTDHRSDASVCRTRLVRDDPDPTNSYVLQLLRRCVCPRLCYNLRAFDSGRVFPHEGTSPDGNHTGMTAEGGSSMLEEVEVRVRALSEQVSELRGHL